MSGAARGRPDGPVRARTARAGLAATALGLVLAGCSDAGTGASSPVSESPPNSPSASVSPSGSLPSPSASADERGEARRGAKDLRGGGYASAVPGSDDPEVTTDTGPRFALSDDVDLEEIERLVRAVERIARRSPPNEQPLVDGGSVQAAVGTFSYRYFADGTVAPDPDWVAANIRTASVPILGRVTCHKVLLVPLRAALREVVERGLAGAIDADEFGGCYVPRFIGRDPARGLSLHTWGIAVDLNVPGNLRGTRGEIDRDVVRIFQRWGFAWGGTWRYTDPMHFELARLVRPR